MRSGVSQSNIVRPIELKKESKFRVATSVWPPQFGAEAVSGKRPDSSSVLNRSPMSILSTMAGIACRLARSAILAIRAAERFS